MYTSQYYLEVTEDNEESLRKYLGDSFPEDENELLLVVTYDILGILWESYEVEIYGITWQDEEEQSYDMREYLDIEEEKLVNLILDEHEAEEGVRL